MNFLIDRNLGGHAEILLGNIASQGWLNLLPIRLTLDFWSVKKIPTWRHFASV
jgi:hypothetical protein